MKPFDFVNQILQGKQNLIVDEQSENEYVPFLVNRSLSYHKDCIIFANEMNKRPLLDKKLQNDFLLNTVRSRKRQFVKWVKTEKVDNLDIVKDFFGFSSAKAIDAIKILSVEEIKELEEKMSIGGIKNPK